VTGGVLVIIEVEPVGKGRPKASRQGGFIRMYTPEKTRSYEQLVADEARKAMAGREPITGPCLLELVLVFKVPASWSKKKRAAALAGEIYPCVKPDSSNCLKAIEDAFNGIVWVDDVQVVELSARKRYGAHPRVEAHITPLQLGSE
jgi:Holliday junction resolvase RusA-like endonuclease